MGWEQPMARLVRASDPRPPAKTFQPQHRSAPAQIQRPFPNQPRSVPSRICFPGSSLPETKTPLRSSYNFERLVAEGWTGKSLAQFPNTAYLSPAATSSGMDCINVFFIIDVWQQIRSPHPYRIPIPRCRYPGRIEPVERRSACAWAYCRRACTSNTPPSRRRSCRPGQGTHGSVPCR